MAHKILIVDDELTLRNTVRAYLEDEGYVVQTADDGLISQEQADWILSRRGGQNSQGGGMNRGQRNSAMGEMGRGAGSNGLQSGDCQYQVP